MVQTVRTTDGYKNQLFQWDADSRVLSLTHGKEIWFVRFCMDGTFEVVGHMPKPSPKTINHK